MKTGLRLPIALKSMSTLNCGLLNVKVCFQTFGDLHLADDCSPVNDIVLGVGRTCQAADAKEMAAEEAYYKLCQNYKIVCELLITPVFMLILVLNCPLLQSVKSSTISPSTFLKIKLRSLIPRSKRSRSTVDCGLLSAKVCSRTFGTSLLLTIHD